jgi:hypothetical protein
MSIKDKLNRKQERQKERREDEAKQTYQNFADRFLQFFINHDNPESSEVEEKRLTLNSQWKTYCKSMNLIPEAYNMFDVYSKALVKEYQDSKQPVHEQPTA